MGILFSISNKSDNARLIGRDSRKVSARKLSDEPPLIIPTLFSPTSTLASLTPGNRRIPWQMANCFSSQCSKALS